MSNEESLKVFYFSGSELCFRNTVWQRRPHDLPEGYFEKQGQRHEDLEQRGAVDREGETEV